MYETSVLRSVVANWSVGWPLGPFCSTLRTENAFESASPDSAEGDLLTQDISLWRCADSSNNNRLQTLVDAHFQHENPAQCRWQPPTARHVLIQPLETRPAP